MRFIPEDIGVWRPVYESEGKGICGPSTIAVLLEKTLTEILNEWDNYKGYASVKEMKRELEKYGFKIKQRRGYKSKEFPSPMSGLAVVRIQFLNDGKEWDSWVEATKHTHYVLIELIDNEWWIFCNNDGWFKRNDENTEKYLKNAYVSSYLELIRVRK